ncbi:MAG: hypothetical protein CHH17_05545 [Candidatus Fluviicola riflensis]|nr:MAG: hypothetical protein CHH17_05545 [Candidatus Fluviicola riflensis]
MMNSYAEKTVEQSKTIADNGAKSSFINNRPEALTMRNLKDSANNSAQVQQLKAYQTMADQAIIQRQANTTGMPDNLKSGIENLSGYSMSDVKVHYNSDKPAQLNAHAYAQGTQIHLASGQEKHLPHEAWHVVQQKQGRVKPTMQLKGKVAINDDAGLENEADVMGAKAMQFKQDPTRPLNNDLLLGTNMPVQKVGEDTREVDIKELSDDQVYQHMEHSFKKGEMKNPVINQAGNLVQRVKKSFTQGGDLFVVLKSDLNTGTGTSKGTREYVNDDNTYKPEEILFDYVTSNTTAKATATIKGNKKAYSVDNPEADKSYKSGSYWDAGHKLGRQNGGLGNDNDWVFPQNPAFNQGNSKNMDDLDSEETRPAWRNIEDDFHEGVKKDGAGAWWIKQI